MVEYLTVDNVRYLNYVSQDYEHILYDKRELVNLYKYNCIEDIPKCAIKTGNIELVKACINGIYRYAITNSITFGHLHLLKYFISQGYSCGKYDAYHAAECNESKIYKFICKTYRLYMDAIVTFALNNNLEMVKYIHTKNDSCINDLSYAAIKHNNMDMLQFAIENKLYTDYAIVHAIDLKNINALKYLDKLGLVVTYHALVKLYMSSDIDLINEVISLQKMYKYRFIKLACKNGENKKVIAYLCGRGHHEIVEHILRIYGHIYIANYIYEVYDCHDTISKSKILKHMGSWTYNITHDPYRD